jgi:hypothetical protein
MSQLCLENTNDPADFDRIVTSLTNKIMATGDIDYPALRTELRGYSVALIETNDPNALADELSKIQGFRDRVLEIERELTDNYYTHKRVVEILTEGWPKFSQEKSAEKREGEAQLKLSQFIMAANDAELAWRYAFNVRKNLESQQQTVFQQIKCAISASNYLGRHAFNPDGMPAETYREEQQEENTDPILDMEKFDNQ